MSQNKHILKRVNERYMSPVPPRWRRLGDSLLYISVMIQPIVIESHFLPDKHKAYAMVLIQAIGVLGKVLTNFAKN